MSLVGAAQWRHGFQDVHPPLYYAFLEFWGQFGSGEFWLRSSSVLASLLSFALWIRLLRQWRPELALTCVFMMAVSFADLQQARELRMYAWLQLWVLAYFCALLENRPRLAALALLLASFTHLFGLFLVPLGMLRGWSRWIPLVVGLWLAWGVPHYLGQQNHPLDLRQRPDLTMGLEAVGRLSAGRVAAFGDRPSIALGVLVLGWLLWRRPDCPRLVYAWALLPLISVWLVSRFTSLQIFEFKYLVWTTPAWVYLLAASLPRVPLILGWTLINLWGALPWLAYPHRWLADWRGVAQELASDPRPIYVHPSMMAAPLFCYGYGAPRLNLVDEWPQLESAVGQNIIWVTTPNHPYVRQQSLRVGLEKFWKLEQERDFASQLPSSDIRVSFWRWRQAPPSSKENQAR